MPLGAFKAALMGTAGVATETVVLLSTQTASNSASISFTSGIDSTYGEYIFSFYNINPATDGAQLHFQANATDTADYDDIAITSTNFTSYHTPSDSHATLAYQGGSDQAQGTAFQPLTEGISSDADHSGSGTLHLFNPSSTTYVKHFISKMQGGLQWNDAVATQRIAGYFNTTAAIDDIQFKVHTGNFDGKIKMWGVK